MYKEGEDGVPVVTGLRVGRKGDEKIVTADAYVAALDVPGVKKLIPQDWRKMKMVSQILCLPSCRLVLCLTCFKIYFIFYILY